MAIKIDIPIELIKPSTSKKSLEMVGKKFGRLLVLKYLGVYLNETKTNKRQMVLAKCDCGSTHIYESRGLRNGWCTSCGCFQAENSSRIHIKHGHKSPKHGKRGTILYARWRSMFDRVRSDPRYKNVKICDRWKGENGFINFCLDMGEMPSKKHTLDRYPICNGDYKPDNTRWATMVEQCNNTTRNVKLLYNGKMLSLSEIARMVNINPRELNRRINNLKLSLDEALKYVPKKIKK